MVNYDKSRRWSLKRDMINKEKPVVDIYIYRYMRQMEIEAKNV